MTCDEETAAILTSGHQGDCNDAFVVDVVNFDSSQCSDFLGTDYYDLLIRVETDLIEDGDLADAVLKQNAIILFCDGDYDLTSGNCTGTLVSVENQCASDFLVENPAIADICYKLIARAPSPEVIPDIVEVRNVPHSTVIISIVLVDSDADGIADDVDNCVGVANPDQLDMDGDGIGHVCDADADGDGCDSGVDCNDLDPLAYPGTVQETSTTYNGQYVFQVDDYSSEPATAGVTLRAVVSAQTIPEGWEAVFEVIDLTNDTVISTETGTVDSEGIAQAVSSDIPVGIYTVYAQFNGDGCYYNISQDFATIDVYDPTGWFATGGGWYMADDDVTGLSGRANFGFNVLSTSRRYRQAILNFSFKLVT